MAKRHSIWKFVILGLVIVLGIFFTFGSFPLAGSSYKYYKGFINAIPLGLDLSGGVSAVYRCSLSQTSNTDDLSGAIDSTVSRLESLLYDEGYSEATVVRQGSNKIRIEVPSLTNTDELFDIIGKPASLYITLKDNLNREDVQSYSGQLVSGEQIENVYVSYNQQDNVYGVVVDFNNDGSQAFSSITQSAASGDKKLYVYIGEDTPLQLTCEEQITGGSTFISGGSITDYESAKEYATMIMSGTFSATLELEDNSVVSATLGKDALMYGLIAAGIALFLVMVIMYIRYGHFGLLANVSLVVYILLMIFFLQAIPFIQLTLPGIAGIILSIGMAVDGNIIIFERIKEEYASGKKIPLSAKNGFKKAFWPIFDSNITTIFSSIILYFLGTASIKGFALTLLVGIVLSMFSTLVVTRFLVKWYLPLNSTKVKPLRLKRSKILNPDFDKPQLEDETEIAGIDERAEKEIVIGAEAKDEKV